MGLKRYNKEIGYIAGGIPGAYAADALFGEEDEGYGRYYDPISSDDSDYAEDSAEQKFGPRLRQNVQDRWVQPENQVYNPLTRTIYRNADRAEDLAERRYGSLENRSGRVEDAGMEQRASMLEDRQGRVADRAMDRSKFQEQNKMFKEPQPMAKLGTAAAGVGLTNKFMQLPSVQNFIQSKQTSPAQGVDMTERIKKLRMLGLNKYADFISGRISPVNAIQPIRKLGGR